MRGHLLSAITASPRVGGAVVPSWMKKVGATCECGTVIVGDDALAVRHSYERHLFAVRREAERTHYPIEWTPGRTVCAACMPLADWPCDEIKEVW
jgi:hypothetical protein